MHGYAVGRHLTQQVFIVCVFLCYESGMLKRSDSLCDRAPLLQPPPGKSCQTQSKVFLVAPILSDPQQQK